MIGWKPTSGKRGRASVRLRCLYPLQELRRGGYPIELFDSRRMANYRLVLYSKRYDEASCREARALKAAGARIVFDLCDNRFHNPYGLESQRAGAKRLREMVSMSDGVTVSSAPLADVIQREVGAVPPMTVIEDPLETSAGLREFCPSGWCDRWRARRRLGSLLRRLSSTSRSAVVWFGQHGIPYGGGGMKDLLGIKRILEDVDRRWPIQLTVVSNSREKFQTLFPSAGERRWSFPVHYLEWHPETFLDALRAQVLAVLPITPTPISVCKSSNRLALALSLGLAVVAGGIPSYFPLRTACRLDDWTDGLITYLSDPVARSRDVDRGRALAERRYNVSTIADQWRAVLDDRM